LTSILSYSINLDTSQVQRCVINDDKSIKTFNRNTIRLECQLRYDNERSAII